MYRLLTSEQEAKLRENGERTDGGDEIDNVPVVKLFVKNGRAMWLLTELSPFYEGLAFGLCDLGMGTPKLGNVYLPELEIIKHATTDEWLVPRIDMFKPVHTLSVYTEAARAKREITEDRLRCRVQRIGCMGLNRNNALGKCNLLNLLDLNKSYKNSIF